MTLSENPRAERLEKRVSSLEKEVEELKNQRAIMQQQIIDCLDTVETLQRLIAKY